MSSGNIISERQLHERIIYLVQRERRRILPGSSNEEIAKEFGLRLRVDTLPIGKEGAYIESDAKIILNCGITSVERLQFTFYHELVHHLIREDDDLYSDLNETYVSDADFDKAIEKFCNIGAAELILPRDIVRSSITNNGFSINLVPQLCLAHRVSGPAALIQLVQYAPDRCFGVVCEHGLSPIMERQNQKVFFHLTQAESLYILYAMVSPGQKYSLARWTVISKNHLLAMAYETKNYAEGIDRIPFRSRKEWLAQCQALFFRGNVYGLFIIESPPSNQQLLLL